MGDNICPDCGKVVKNEIFTGSLLLCEECYKKRYPTSDSLSAPHIHTGALMHLEERQREKVKDAKEVEYKGFIIVEKFEKYNGQAGGNGPFYAIKKSLAGRLSDTWYNSIGEAKKAVDRGETSDSITGDALPLELRLKVK